MADLPPMCPHCGFNFRPDSVIERGAWRLTPSSAEYSGAPVNLAPQECGALYSIAAMNGRPITALAIGQRIAVDAENFSNLGAVVLCKARKKLGSIYPVVNVWGRGYVWSEAS